MGVVMRAAVVLIIACLFFSSGRADGVLTSVGPTSAQTNFPLYYSDAGGLALELCLIPPDAGPPCFFDPVIAGNALSEATGFGGEGFWFLAESSIATPTVTGLLVMAVEAAYGAGDPAPNDQISFARVRIRIDVPDGTPGGTYTVTYPYGVKVYSDVPGCTTDPVGGTCPNIVNETVDVGVGAPGVFTGALAGEIGPFLTMDPLDPNYAAITALYPGYIGDLNTPVAVVGSPLGTNYFRIQGPGGIDVQQPLFTLMGKLFTGNIPTPLVIESATYTRSAVPGSLWHMEVFAASASSAIVTVEGAGFLARPMSGDGAGGFFSYIPMLGATGLPSTVTLTADNSATVPTNIPTVMSAPVTDMVTITKALYNVGLKELTIEAFSSDQAVPPILTATGFTTLTGGSLIISPTTPPATVEVVSSAGGRDVRAVDILPLPFFASLDAGPGPLLINFIDLSSNNPTGWLWDFGDGTTSTEQSPVHMYSAPGSYTVTLTVTTAGGPVVTTALNYISVAGACPNGPARIVEAATDWASLQIAYNSALDTNSIGLLAVSISGPLDFNLPKSVALLGGFDCEFQASLGMTTISGSLTISSGTATIDRITIL